MLLCIIKEGVKVASKAIFEAYQRWCQENGEKPVTQNALGAVLSERGLTRKRGTGGSHWWHGIGLATEEVEDSDPSDPSYPISGIFPIRADSRKISGKEGTKGHFEAKGSLIDELEADNGQKPSAEPSAGKTTDDGHFERTEGTEGKIQGVSEKKNDQIGCDFYQTTGHCRAAYQLELMTLPVKPGLEGVGCRSFQTSGQCPAAIEIEKLCQGDDALFVTLEETQETLPWK